MGSFSVPIKISNISTGESVERDAMVDTGATLTVITRETADLLRLQPVGTTIVKLAGGGETTWDIVTVNITIAGFDQIQARCLVAPNGTLLLGIVVLETLLLAVDPIAKKLVPTAALAMGYGA